VSIQSCTPLPQGAEVPTCEGRMKLVLTIVFWLDPLTDATAARIYIQSLIHWATAVPIWITKRKYEKEKN